jgi:hypothetical protein
MKKVLFTGIFFVIALVGNSQEPTIKWSEPFDKVKKTSIYHALFSNESYYVIRRNDWKSIDFVDRFDKQLKYQNTAVLDINSIIPIKGGFAKSQFFMFHNAPFYCAKKSKNDKKAKGGFYLENAIGSIKSDGNVIVNNDLTGILKNESLELEKSFGTFYDVSDNDSLIVIYSKTSDASKDIFHIKLFDTSMKLLWQKEIKVPDIYPNGSIEKLSVSNDGNIAILEKLYTKKDYEASVYKVLLYNNKLDKTEEYNAYLGNRNHFDAEIKFDKNNDLLIIGYSYDDKRNTAENPSYFFYKIDSRTKKMVVSKEELIDKTLFTINTSRINENVFLESEYFRYKLKNIFSIDNGDNFLFLERKGSGSLPTTGSDYISAGNLIVVCIKPDGTHKWMNRIAKMQISYSESYLSFLYTISGDDIYILYNDHPKNIKTNDLREIKDCDMTFSLNPDPMMVVAKMNSNGEVTKREIPQPDVKNKVAVLSDSGCKIKNGEFLFLAKPYKEDLYRMAYLSLK